MDTHSPRMVEIPEELAKQLEELVERIANSDLARHVRVDAEVALRIALARGLEALLDESKSALE